MKAGDARRIAALNQIQKALSMYMLDHGHYPPLTDVRTYREGVNTDEFEAAIEPYYPGLDLNDTFLGPYFGSDDTEFYYSSGSNDNYQHYGMAILLLSDKFHDKEINDGGYFSTMYEVGADPTYCKQKYHGGNSCWLWSPIEDRCRGGN